MGKIRVVITLVAMFMALCAASTSCADSILKPKSDQDMFKVTVRIMNFEETSGGTGVILKSSRNGSVIMTNKHVCRLIEHGGVIDPPDHIRHAVAAYKEDPAHDLCLVTTDANLGVSIKISKDEPELGDEAIIAGHPALLPTIVTRGMFSEHKIIQVVDGQRDCTDLDKVDPTKGLICLREVKLPIIEVREAQLVSATIMPGSSGSPVFNRKGQLSGLVFAGSGDLSYAFIVPLESIWNFMSLAKQMEWTEAK